MSAVWWRWILDVTVVGVRKHIFPIDEPLFVQFSCRRELNFICFCVSTLPFPPSTVAWSLLVEVWAPEANSGHRSDTPCFKNSIFPKEVNNFSVGQMKHPRVCIENYVFVYGMLCHLDMCGILKTAIHAVNFQFTCQ